MKKSYAIMAVLGVMAAAVAFAVTRGSTTAKSYVDTLNEAGSLRVSYTSQLIGGTAETTTVLLSKPNMAKIERANELIVADGSKITVFDKKANSFYRKDQTPSEFAGLFASEDMQLWAPFFDAKAMSAVAEGGREAGSKTRRGMKLSVVEALVDPKSGKQGTFYFSPEDKLIRQAEFTAEKGGMKATTVLNATQITVGAAVAGEMFAFNAPDGAKEVSLADLMADKWYHDVEEAKKAAAASNRRVMLDFYAEWCGPCKMLMRDVFPTAEFKAMSKYFVFCKIDVDQQPAVAQAFGISAMPTIKFIKADGTVVHEFMGYRATADFVAEMHKAKDAN